jgi:NAD(P)-dependent dehydrogenase (short-subunit alcohol dehydrogenase family)
MNVLITGGGGTMAQAIKKILEENHYNVYAPTKEEMDITNELLIEKVMIDYAPDILINNAGYIIPNSIKNISLGEWEKHLKINLTGAFLCSKEAILNGCKVIINIGSTSAFEGRATWGAYCASKAGGISLIETLVEEGIEAYSINPARTDTKMRKGLFPNEDPNTLMPPERIGKFILRILNKEFENGSHLIITKDKHIIIPKRRCPK